MELESLKRQLTYLEEAEIKIEKIVTDRHTQVSAFMAQEKPTIQHAYDAWHLAKGNVSLKFKRIYPTRQIWDFKEVLIVQDPTIQLFLKLIICR